MREIWVIERDRVSHDGCTVLCERKNRGLLREDGSFCLLAYCRKRVPYPREQTERLITVKEKGKDAA